MWNSGWPYCQSVESKQGKQLDIEAQVRKVIIWGGDPVEICYIGDIN